MPAPVLPHLQGDSFWCKTSFGFLAFKPLPSKSWQKPVQIPELKPADPKFLRFRGTGAVLVAGSSTAARAHR